MANSNDVLDEALQLPTQDRARIAHGLLVSLEDECEVDVEEAWAAEIRRRIADVRSGRVEMLDWETVHDEIRADLKQIESS